MFFRKKYWASILFIFMSTFGIIYGVKNLINIPLGYFQIISNFFIVMLLTLVNILLLYGLFKWKNNILNENVLDISFFKIIMKVHVFFSFIFIIFIVLNSYSINSTESAVVTRLGKVKKGFYGNIIFMKMPIIDDIQRYKRINKFLYFI